MSITGQLDAGNVVVDAGMDVVGALSANSLLIDTTTTLTGNVSCAGAFDVVGALSAGSILVDGTTALTGAVTAPAGITADITGSISTLAPLLASHVLLSTTIESANRNTTNCQMATGTGDSDDYIGNIVVLVADEAGGGHYVARTITDYNVTNNVITWSPAIAHDPVDGGAIYIIPGDTAIRPALAIAQADLDTITGTGGVLIGTDAMDRSGTLDVNTKTITANAITATAINADAITEAKIADNAIAAEHIAAAAIDNATFAADVGSTAYATNIIALAVRKALDDYDPPTNSEFELRSLPTADYTVVGDLGVVQSADNDTLLTAIAGYLDTEIAALVTAIITNAAGIDIAADIIALKAVADTIATDTTTDIPALIGTAQADLDIITAADGVNLTAATQASIDAIEADTDELQGDWVNAGRLDAILDAILAMLDDARTEPGDAAPPVNPDAMTKLDYLYKFMRNKIETTATRIHVYNDAGDNKDHSSIISDDDTTFTRGEFAAGD